MHTLKQWSIGAALVCCALALGCGADDDDGSAGSGAAGFGGSAPIGGMSGTTSLPMGGTMMPSSGSSGAMGASGCGSESFTAIYNDILSSPTYMCNTPVCHGKMTGQTGSVGNLELMTKDMAYGDLVGKMSDSALCGDVARTRVMPGNAAMSLLVQKLRGDTVMCGSVMPVTGTSITDPELARITNWINAGACNN
jgi:hypothetical protein